MPHPLFALSTALLISTGMAMVEDRTPRERLYAGARTFLSFVVAIVGGGWLMHWIHG